MKRTRKSCLSAVVAISFVVIGLTAGSLATAASASAASPVRDLIAALDKSEATYGEWSARWWQWVFAIEHDINPLLDTTG